MRATGSPPEQPRAAAAADTPAETADGTRADADAPAESGAHAGPVAVVLAAGREPELAWLVLWLICLVAIVAFPAWQLIPFDLVWITLALLYGFRLWPSRRAVALLATAILTTGAAVGDDLVRHLRIASSIEQVPLLATLLVAMAWQANRRMAARDRAEVAAEAERLLVVQRQFLQDASHQLRTPITIALGHAELLAGTLAGYQQRDIHVVVGELERLKALSDRLLLVAASESPNFLRREPADLDGLAVDLLRRWRPTTPRRWRLGQLAPVRAVVDVERLRMALDALIENSVRHTRAGDEIEISVLGPDDAGFASIVVQDSGEGIAEADIPHIFERFRTTTSGAAHGTGLGLALVQAIARGHGGEVTVQSALGRGSRFALLLPVAAEFAIPRAVAGPRAVGGSHGIAGSRPWPFGRDRLGRAGRARRGGPGRLVAFDSSARVAVSQRIVAMEDTRAAGFPHQNGAS